MVAARLLLFAIRYSPFATRQSLTQLFVLRVTQESIGEFLEAFLDPLTEVFSYTAALLDGAFIVCLQQAVVDIGHAVGQSSAMQQAIQRGEVLEPAFLQDGCQVKFDIGLTTNKSRIAQQP
jgi:hypothetical protein